MIVLRTDHRLPEQAASRMILLFGRGLIGDNIVMALRSMGTFQSSELPYDWESRTARAACGRAILAQLQTGRSDVNRIDFIWAAGRAGFGALDAELAPEMSAFEDVLDLAQKSMDAHPDALHVFHHTSSAGGLFEGQRLVNLDSAPNPKRPYGVCKLAQERTLSRLGENCRKLIYRPSSVYGYSVRSLRTGVISALINDNLNRRMTRVFGSSDTIRDYISAADIGRFVSARLQAHPDDDQTVYTLASGKPTSLYEVLCTVRSITGQPLMLRFDPQPNNSDDITFDRSVLPDDLKTIDLATGIRLTLLQMSSAFTEKANYGQSGLAL